MNPRAFQSAWTEQEDNLRPIALSTLEPLELTADAVTFLNSCGLPDSAAPCLGFVGDVVSKNKWDAIGTLSGHFNLDDPGPDRYVVIGSDGSGCLIALNREEACRVEWLDHEDDFSPQFMNTSIGQLAGCLLVYREFMRKTTGDRDEQDLLFTKFTDEQFDGLRTSLAGIDPHAVTEGFWKAELDLLLAMREADRKKD